MRTGCRTIVLLACLVTLIGCQKEQQVKPDYNRPLPPGANALRLLLDLSQWPDLKEPWETRDAGLTAAIQRSQQWFSIKSTQSFFPLFDVTHLRARTSLYAFSKILAESQSASAFEQRIQAEFDCYTSVGYDNKGSVLFTGYYTPIFKGSLTQTSVYKYPLYTKPKDLAIEPLTGKVLGRKVGSGYQPYPARREIESSNMLKGTELVWVADRLDQYIIQVNGSAKIDLTDGSTMYVGYAGNNGHEYTGLGATLIKEGVIEPERLSLASIRQHFAGKPAELERYIEMNDRYVFFARYDGSNWPAGSLGVKVEPQVSLATDKSVFPRGGIVVINTRKTPLNGAASPLNRFMLDQDTGGAIRAAGRADIYYGVGPNAEQNAGGQFAEGRMYYFFLKHGKTLEWHQRMLEEQPPTPSKPVKPIGKSNEVY
ncbi:hypothetical protein HED60_04120 [Planctomycetales bacterium ZRK34]|nr:hypothetical protein HED60_04120 [Planctomycetales bacterium ZRK34]